MAERRQVQQSIRQLQKVKTWQLMILLILMLFVSATFLRINNTGMIQRRNAVAAADKSGNVQDIAARIYDLQRWSAAHMNADSGTFYLQEQYNRDAQRALSQSSDLSAASAQANADAEAVCHPQFNGWSTAYMQCFLAELAKHPSSEKLPEPKLPSPALYRYSFVSPLWSPDFAGWSIIGCLVIIIMIIGRIISLFVLRLMLRRHYQSV
ncbi:MAG: hypothetical protein KDA17_02920 [Candidatus Saccharibacteria bacterium]|nr:hypothetical protein [Candidatus Saccharibacteria bacterium]